MSVEYKNCTWIMCEIFVQLVTKFNLKQTNEIEVFFWNLPWQGSKSNGGKIISECLFILVPIDPHTNPKQH